jgi:uncharacterized protein YcbK (DUF882 family)
MSLLWTRRRLVQTVVTGGLGVSLARLAAAQEAKGAVAAELPERAIELFNTHRRKRVPGTSGALNSMWPHSTLKKVLRDHRNGESHDMDPRLFDQLHTLSLAAHCEPRYEIISGYRSPESNDKMSSRPGSGVAKKSLHMQGRALDVRLKHCPCTDLRDLALAAKQGGVGYYQRSDFVHIDTGAFRTWIG